MFCSVHSLMAGFTHLLLYLNYLLTLFFCPVYIVKNNNKYDEYLRLKNAIFCFIKFHCLYENKLVKDIKTTIKTAKI